MGGFVGIIKSNENMKNEKENIIKMNNALANVGPDESGYFIDDNILLAHRRLILLDSDGRKTANDL